MAKYETKFIDISNICLNTGNFRHNEVSSEPEAIQTLLSNDTEHKVLDLATDIVEQEMLDPSSKLIVAPDENNEGHFIVLEGNRRVTALKTLINPEFSKNLKSYAQFKKLSPKFLQLNIVQAESVIIPPHEAQVWIKRKHYTGMGGKGTLPWGALGSARSDAKEGKYAPWLTAINFLADHGVDTSQIMRGIETKTTTVDRVLANNKRLDEILGISLNKDGSVSIDVDDTSKAITLIEALLTAMASPNFKETDVTNSTLQIEFLNKFSPQNCKKPSPRSDENIKPAEEAADNTTRSTSTNSNTGQNEPTKKTKIYKTRRSLAKKGLQISNPGLNKFYLELCKLPVATYEHSSAAMLRVFLEKATVVYLEKMAITEPNGRSWQNFEIKLREKIWCAVNSIDPNKSNNELRFARQAGSGNKDGFHSLNILNEYIHSHEALPAPSEIITTWDRFHPYFDKMFQTIEDKNNE